MSDVEHLGLLKQDPHFATKLMHEGQEPEQWSSMAIVTPIITTTTFKQHAPGVTEVSQIHVK